MNDVLSANEHGWNIISPKILLWVSKGDRLIDGSEKGKKNDKNERFTVLQTSSSVISGYILRSSTDHGGFESSHCKLWEKCKNRNVHPPAAPGDQFKIL